MADFVNCNMKSIDIFTIIASLFAKDAADHYPFRIVQKTKKAGDVIVCKSKEEFEHLFRMAIEIAGDGKPALRVCIVDFQSGVNLTDVPPCVNFEGLLLKMRLNFVYDTNDDVCIYLANIT